MIPLNVSPSEAHLLLTVLDLAHKGEAFPVGLYGAEGKAQLVDIAGRVNAALTSRPPDTGHNMAATCPWLTCPIGGQIVLEGRAIVPVGQDLPERVGRLAATWEREGELCRFRLEGDGNLESAWAIVLSAGWAPGPRRVDRVIYTAPPTIEDGDHINVAELVLDGEGRPVRFVVADREDLQEVEAALVRVFGEALEIGEWTQHDDGELVAEVVRWSP